MYTVTNCARIRVRQNLKAAKTITDRKMESIEQSGEIGNK